ncbi:RES domain-containing protein [Actinosynnema sp. NPDC059797]
MSDHDRSAPRAAAPHRYLLGVGTLLWRIHPRRSAAVDFTPHDARRTVHRGRFDGSPADPYPTVNASFEPSAIVAELLLRSIPLPTRGDRTVRRVSVAGRRASLIATAADLDLVSLVDAPALAAVAQDAWLVHSSDIRDPRLGAWVAGLRARTGWAQGLVWPLRAEPQRHLVVLFGDRCGPGVFEPEPRQHFDLDDEFGARWLNSMLAHHRARIALPKEVRAG